jgi:peptidoglycan hydrolase-like protein with peptidoglycan-binding domain
MPARCFAHSLGGTCFDFQSTSSAIVITASVGTGGTNRPHDVRTIQSALNDVPIEDGGADPLLQVDGIAGPLTRAAITNFQGSHTRVFDGRVDPNGPTLLALNNEPDQGGRAATIATLNIGAGAVGRGRAPTRQTPNPLLVATIVALLPKARTLIRAAQFHLTSVGPFVTNRKQTLPPGPFLAGVRDSLTLLDKVFGFFKFNNPRPVFENFVTVYRNMDVALNRSFETAPLIAPVLFVPNTLIRMESVAAAYTSIGGAFLSSKEKFAFGDPANRIYLCNSIAPTGELFKISAVVHELAHYVSSPVISIDDQVHTGHMITPSDKPKFDALSPDKKIRSAEHYAFFAVSAGRNRI